MMPISIKVKSALANFLYSTGVISWKLERVSNQKTLILILMYHRVIPSSETNSTIQAGMIVEPETLDLHIQFLQKHFEIVPLSEIVHLLEIQTREFGKKRFCALTFDDGWYDFREHAFPILKFHETPATVFLPTDFIGTNRWFWTDRLGLLLDRMVSAGNLDVTTSTSGNSLLHAIVHMPGSFEERLNNSIALLKSYKLKEIEQVLFELSELLGEEPTPSRRAFLSWDEVREMASSGLISFGSHTAGHPILTTLTEEEAKHELEKSREIMISQKVVDPAFISFSYPNGNFTHRLSEMVQETGYDLAVTTQSGWNHQGESPYTLRRIAIHQDMTSTEAMFISRIVKFL